MKVLPREGPIFGILLFSKPMYETRQPMEIRGGGAKKVCAPPTEKLETKRFTPSPKAVDLPYAPTPFYPVGKILGLQLSQTEPVEFRVNIGFG